MTAPFIPTPEQHRVINHAGSAYVSACPGAGKTRVMIERARVLLSDNINWGGVAFLSFTTAAVAELERRLRLENLLPYPTYPHFIGTFDAFLWQYLIAPFGVPGSSCYPRLIPDKRERVLTPYPAARPLTLGCFEQTTGAPIHVELVRQGFSGNTRQYETAARNVRAGYLARGELDFDEARQLALDRLRDPHMAAVLARALVGRFKELIVDEAQDCNPSDLEIISWFRSASIPVKVICDPNQSIYGFRGGITDDLAAFAQSFADEERLPLTGNFRSSKHIACSISAFRRHGHATTPDEALGTHRHDPTPVHILAYAGRSVPSTIGAAFRTLIQDLPVGESKCAIVAATHASGARALGHPPDDEVKDLSYRLALAVLNYNLSFDTGRRKEALECVHRVILELEGHTIQGTYHQYLVSAGLQPSEWRPRILDLAHALRYSSERFSGADAWLEEARRLLAPLLPPGGVTINQRLRRNAGLASALACTPTGGQSARTIHSVKGMEFPAVCVVMTTSTATAILNYLDGNGTSAVGEDARKIYVGVSRAERLLAIAIPRSQHARLAERLTGAGATVSIMNL